jgi:hypothetical protein
MKKIFVVLALVGISSLMLFAQDEEDQDRSFSYANRVKVGGAGGVTPIVALFDNKNIDQFLTSAGLPKLGSDPMYLVGGEGYGYIMFLRNVRVGGFGAGGSRTVSTLDFVSNIKREVEYSISYGGFIIDYVRPIAYKLDLAVGASIGGGSVNITMRKDDGKFKQWDSLWSEYGDLSRRTANYSRRLTGGFVTLNPHVSLEYTLLTWLQLRIGLGYPIMLSPEWKVDEKYDINLVPSTIKASGYTVNGGIMFGFFGW